MERGDWNMTDRPTPTSQWYNPLYLTTERLLVHVQAVPHLMPRVLCLAEAERLTLDLRVIDRLCPGGCKTVKVVRRRRGANKEFSMLLLIILL